jgi:hypothetical protein
MNDSDVLNRIRPTHTITASSDFRERVMQAIGRSSEIQAAAPGISWWRNIPALRWVTAGCAAAVLLLVAPMLPTGRVGKTPSGATLLAQSVQAFSGLRSVHINGRIRTLPGDNFELIGTGYDFVPISLWRDYSQPPKWRVEKPGRVAANDGISSVMHMRNSNTAVRGGVDSGFVGWLRPVLDPQTILESELLAARRGESTASVHENGASLVLTVHRAARGNFENDWARNKSISESDHTCVYRFDAASKRLTGLQVLVAGATVAEFDDFRYDEALPAALFRPELPADVAWMDAAPEARTVVLSGPRETARYFFDALRAENWAAVAPLTGGTSVPDIIRRTYGRVEVISIGEPFRSGLYPGYFVPYQVRLSNGFVKKFKLAVRNDNPAQQWMVDGGY